jgi:hypothetical protein
MDITPEMIDAVETLLSFRTDSSTDEQVAAAIDVLDNANLFVPITDARDEEDERYARTMASLRGIDLDDRYPKGDENGIIGTSGGAGFLANRSNLTRDSADRQHWVGGGGTGLDPAEWGDTTREDMARHQG